MANKADSLEALGAKLWPNAFKVINYPSYIFLCGGRIKPNDGAVPSARSVFFEHLKVNSPSILDRVLLAEVASEWYRAGDVYPDLVALEGHIAGLSSIILLFVESPGSIAELGAFSFVESLRNKLVVIVEEHYYDERSFIKEGPLTLLQKNNEKSVLSFPWLKISNTKWVFDSDLCAETVARIAEQLQHRMKRGAGKRSFRASDHGHRMLLVADIARLAGAIRENEILSFLCGLQLQVKPEVLKQYMFLLKNLGIVEQKRYGHVDYLIGNPLAPVYIEYSAEEVIDELRFRDDLQTALPFDRDRRKVYKRHLDAKGAR